jgi:hypothetical protein
MMKSLKAYLSGEDGAVTVDWVVLTAGVVGMAILTYPVISPAVTGMAEIIRDQINSYKDYLKP